MDPSRRTRRLVHASEGKRVFRSDAHDERRIENAPGRTEAICGTREAGRPRPGFGLARVCLRTGVNDHEKSPLSITRIPHPGIDRDRALSGQVERAPVMRSWWASGLGSLCGSPRTGKSRAYCPRAPFTIQRRGCCWGRWLPPPDRSSFGCMQGGRASASDQLPYGGATSDRGAAGPLSGLLRERVR
jgi:hypothetical protein